MTLDRGTLTKIDRRIFSEFDHAEGVQLVKVPVSDATWSTWRRYCNVAGVTMGQGVAGLVVHELGTVVGRDAEDRPCSALRWSDDSRRVSRTLMLENGSSTSGSGRSERPSSG